MATQKKGKLSFTTTFIISLILLVIALTVSILIGDAKIHISTIFDVIFIFVKKEENVIFSIAFTVLCFPVVSFMLQTIGYEYFTLVQSRPRIAI